MSDSLFHTEQTQGPLASGGQAYRDQNLMGQIEQQAGGVPIIININVTDNVVENQAELATTIATTMSRSAVLTDIPLSLGKN